MIDGIQLKICGLTSLEDAAQAAEAGTDYLGFNLYPASPRYLPLERYLALADRLPNRGKVAVAVEPTLSQLAAMNAAGFDFFQVHFRHDLAAATVASWAETIGRSRLWLAPKLPPEQDVPAALLPLAETFLFDTFHPDKFGGTGETGDWSKFARHQQMHPTKTWILSGGLNPENIGDALSQSGARFVDVGSGVESVPGVKDHGKIAALVWAMTGA